jgi:hypothetical protein
MPLIGHDAYRLPEPEPEPARPVPPTSEGPSFTVDQAWFREVLDAGGITSCVSVSPDQIVTEFAGLVKRRIETQREADGIGRNLDREHAKTTAYRTVLRTLAGRLGVTVGPLDTSHQIEVLGEDVLAALRPPTPAASAESGDLAALADEIDRTHRLGGANLTTVTRPWVRALRKHRCSPPAQPHPGLGTLHGFSTERDA